MFPRLGWIETPPLGRHRAGAEALCRHCRFFLVAEVLLEIGELRLLLGWSRVLAWADVPLVAAGADSSLGLFGSSGEVALRGMLRFFFLWYPPRAIALGTAARGFVGNVPRAIPSIMCVLVVPSPGFSGLGSGGLLCEALFLRGFGGLEAFWLAGLLGV